MKMTLIKRSSAPSFITSNQQGIVSIELAFVIPMLFLLFAFSWQAGRYLYWQQQLDFTTNRFSKILVLEIIESRSINRKSIEDTLEIIQNTYGDEFEFGLTVNILSDDSAKEQSFQVGDNCPDTDPYPNTIQDLPLIDTAIQAKMPKRYILGLSLCAQARKWSSIVLNPTQPNLISQSLRSHYFYPINHVIFN